MRVSRGAVSDLGRRLELVVGKKCIERNETRLEGRR